MDYLHHSSVPATKSELELFHVPATQTAIEGYYEVEYRPTSTLDGAKSFDINIPSSDDYTDLSETMITAKVSIKDSENKEITSTEDVNVVNGFANTLFEQIDFYLGSVNIAQANNLYHYQAYLEDLIFKHPSKADAGAMWDDADSRKKFITKPFQLFFRLHSPMCGQNNLLLSGVPILLRLTRAGESFGLIKGAANTKSYKISILDLTVQVRRVKVFPDVALAIQGGLERNAAKYFVTRNEVKSFVIPQSITTMAFESVFSGILPRRMIIGFVKNTTHDGTDKDGPFKFDNFGISSLSAYINGNQVPSIAYTPNFSENLYMKEFVNLWRFTNQNQGIPMLKLKYDAFKSGSTLFAFDFAPDGSVGGETGTLSLLKRGNIRVEVKFSSALASSIHMIVFAQFDNLVQIDKYRNISVDW